MHTHTTQNEPPPILKLLAHEVRWHLLIALSNSDYRVHELSNLLQKPLNLISYHLRLLRSESIVTEHRSSADARDVYYSLDFDHFQKLYNSAVGTLHPALANLATNNLATNNLVKQTQVSLRQPVRVLFLCTHNSAVSQLAEALLRHMAGDRVEVFSAGAQPSEIHPKALELLQRDEIDTSGLSSKSIEQFIGQRFDFIITVCDRERESCPVFPGAPEQIHWSFPDPSAVEDTTMEHLAFVRTFAALKRRLELLLILINRQ